MKKLVLLLLILFVLLGGYFVWENVLSGSKSAVTAIAPASENISELVRENNSPIQKPSDFSVSVLGELEGARDLEPGPDGSVFVSSPDTGQVVMFQDADGDGVSDTERLVAESLNSPHGLLFQCEEEGEGGNQNNCTLYIAEEDRVSAFEYNTRTNEAINPTKLLDLPVGGRHTTRTLLFNPKNENELLISVGSSCNVCIEDDDRQGSVLFYNFQTGESGKYATGLRNAVFMTARPGTDEAWVTEMGRDGLGDNTPPDELNILRRDGFYGWPWYYGDDVRDQDFEGGTEVQLANELVSSRINMQAHVAPLGLDFIPQGADSLWPEEYQGDLMVGLHGSWNRSTPVGYKVVRYDLSKDQSASSTTATTTSATEEPIDFLTGWLKESGGALGRPVDVLAQEDGTLYVTDDKAGVVYSVRYRPQF